MSKHVQGSISAEELLEFNSWLSKRKENKLEFEDIKVLWKRSGEFTFPHQIDSKRSLNSVHEKAGIKKLTWQSSNIIIQIAAVLVLSVILSGVYSYFFSQNESISTSEIYQEISAAYGTRTTVDLPDGTKVFLNSGSSLRYSNQFGDNNLRKVKLNGEGYFKVAKDSRRPFVVNVNDLDVKVLGTTFNINAYEPESEIEVVLVEGSVAIADANKKSSDNLMVLSAYDKAFFDASENTLFKEHIVDIEKYIGWVEGKLIFIDDPIQDVVKKLGNWYNVDFKIKNNRLDSYRLTGTFINESLEEILNTISLTSPLEYRIINASLNSNGNYTKRKIILK